MWEMKVNGVKRSNVRGSYGERGKGDMNWSSESV